MNKKDITNLSDIKILVCEFYDKVRLNEVLAPIFNAVIKGKWPYHLEKMVRFWQTILLQEHTYKGAPFPVHIDLPIGQEHFEIWVALFNQTVHENFEGAKALEAIDRANKMAMMFSYKLAALAEQRQN
ncbi:group III truncated hemoglobin [Flavobacteriaceae bacterium F08102]|nr:group III truncated hemoglobin [Flavobacteriaceae bacterium F08102]